MPHKDRRAYRQSNKEAIAEYQREWRNKNREHVRALNLASFYRNRETRLARQRVKYARDPSRVLAYNAARRQPASWANRKKIERIYQLAAWASKFTDEPLEVDHIDPLRGKTISGLHVETNLQILKRSENRRKWNRWASSQTS